MLMVGAPHYNSDLAEIALFNRAVNTRSRRRTSSPARRSLQKRNSSLRKTSSPRISSRFRQMLRDRSEADPVTAAAMSRAAFSGVKKS